MAIGLPTSLWLPEPSTTFNKTARRMAELLAIMIGVQIDPSIYAKTQPLRAPNSRYPKSGLHKRRLTYDELNGLSLKGVIELARTPTPFDLPTPPAPCEQAKADWLQALADAEQTANVKASIQANGKPRLNRGTLGFIRNGADCGDRHRLLFSAAANLAEFGCLSALAHELLTPAALEAGLSPSDTQRQIECGLKNTKPLPIETDVPMPTPSACPAAKADDLQEQLRSLWQSSQAPVAEQAEEIGTPPDVEEHGDAWEHPLDRLGADETGPYGKEGERR